MKLTILGAGTCIPYPDHSPAGHMLEIDGTPILLDAGPGTIVRLAEQGISYRDLDYILLTHFHSDHTLDLLTFLQANNATPGWKRTKAVILVGPRGTEEALRRLFDVFDGTAPEGFPLEIHELGAERLEFQTWHLESELTGHTPTSLAYRISDRRKSLVYTGDAASTQGIARLAADADLLLIECSLPDGWRTPDHLTPRQVGEVASRANVHRVVLTHLYPPALATNIAAEVGAYFDGPVAVGHDGWSVLL
jgi:ribonuclease BN (tRNA processing enzyme)